MNENVNLCEILKSCPINTGFYSPMIGNCKLISVNSFEVVVSNLKGVLHINPNATATLNGYKTVELMLFPSQTQRDWSKWVCPKPKKKPKFNPKTLKPFGKILSRNVCNEVWTCDFVSHLSEGKNLSGDVRIYVIGVGNTRRYSIPYNEETKYLVGTSDEAPDYYRYWED